MARRTHQKVPEEEASEQIAGCLKFDLPPIVQQFFEIEAKRLSEKHGKHVFITDIARALMAAYYEKRMAGLLIDPDD